MLLGLVTPTAGTATIAGRPYRDLPGAAPGASPSACASAWGWPPPCSATPRS
jgi:hypothetical protein